MKILYLSTWPPRSCGIATFAYDLAMAIQKIKPNLSWQVMAIDEPTKKYKYDKEVIYKINQQDPQEFIKATDFINKSNFDLLVIQHEFNLYGKNGGKKIIPFLKKINKPIVVILHSVPHPQDPNYNYKKQRLEVIRAMSGLVKKFVVISNIAKIRLIKIYKIDAAKIVVISHGSIDFPKKDPQSIKKELELANTTYLLNFGFLGKRKGLETIIKAMGLVIKKYPLVKLVFVGGVNPSFKKGFNEYFHKIKLLVKKLNLEQNVIFNYGFIPIEEVIKYFQAADIFVYANNFKSQVSSGPLTYALVAGKPIVSTYFSYAEDVLKNKGGFLVNFGDYRAMAENICKLIANPKLKSQISARNYQLGRHFLWDNVAIKYINLFKEII